MATRKLFAQLHGGGIYITYLWSTRKLSRIRRPATTPVSTKDFRKPYGGLVSRPLVRVQRAGDHFRVVFVPPITTGVYRRRDKNRHSWFLSWTLYKYLPSRTLPVYGDNQPLTKVTVYGILLPPSIPSLFLFLFLPLSPSLSLPPPSFSLPFPTISPPYPVYRPSLFPWALPATQSPFLLAVFLRAAAIPPGCPLSEMHHNR